MRGRKPVADALDDVVDVCLGRIHHLDRAPVLAAREGAQHAPDLAEPLVQEVVASMSQVPDSHIACGVELSHGGGPHVDHLGSWHRPGEFLVVFPGDRDDAVSRVGVASKLREDLVSGDTHRHGEAELVLHALRYLVRDEHGVPSEERQRSRDVDP